MAIQRERELVARCSEPAEVEIFTGLLRWAINDKNTEFDLESPLAKILGEHHREHAGHRHGNFALFLNEQLAKMPPVNDPNLANLMCLYPLSIGTVTVIRTYDQKFTFTGLQIFGYIKPQIK